VCGKALALTSPGFSRLKLHGAPQITTLITAVIAHAYILGNPDMPPQVLTTTWLGRHERPQLEKKMPASQKTSSPMGTWWGERGRKRSRKHLPMGETDKGD